MIRRQWALQGGSGECGDTHSPPTTAQVKRKQITPQGKKQPQPSPVFLDHTGQLYLTGALLFLSYNCPVGFLGCGGRYKSSESVLCESSLLFMMHPSQLC